jgi:hypothetical protein
MTIVYVAIAKRDKRTFRFKASHSEQGSRDRWNEITAELLKNELEEVRQTHRLSDF